ncbi:SLBB domain-containing protein [Deefgea tanakiae]|uniref:SLBB domain-containing protein n=1 Tax=Deefgea tanakiae TaxID=2865840 RepID=A0ABX8ZBR2_9NEIS|nr:SLBB domain-containing protein [Deefgea tanakiae]QZA78304.1 SLBB domain-containing protein [Deefgea tanakiae]
MSCYAAPTPTPTPTPTPSVPFSATAGQTLPAYNPIADSTLRQNPAANVQSANIVPCSSGDGSPFQRLVCDSLGHMLPIYGENLLNFAAASDVEVSADYPVGPGDELLLKVWGSVDLSSRLVVDRNGAVFIPNVGNIPVAGTPFGQMNNVIGKAIAVYYKDLKIAISMGQIRSIAVYMTGMSKVPGRLMVNSNSTLLNAVMAAGGVGPQGSLRKIELRRMGQLIGTFDLYDLLLKGDKSKDLRVQSGDVIFVPPVGPQVALLGTVKQPAIYELKGGESAHDLLLLAGGETILNRAGLVQVEQIKDRKIRSAKTVQQADLATFKLSNGDILKWTELSLEYSGVVNLRSSLGLAVREAWTPGMKVSDLIRSPDYLLTPKYWANLNQGIFTAAQAGGEQDKQIRTLTQQVGQEINWEYASIQRRDPKTFVATLIGFNLAKALQKDPKADVELQADDVVTIFTRNELRAPAATQGKFVTIEGEVAVPGVYQLKANETLQDVVARAGGVTDEAWIFAAELGRESVRVQQRKSLNEMADEMEAAALELQSKTLQNATMLTGGDLAAKGQSALGTAVIAKIRNTQPTGRIVLGVAPDASELDLPDAILEDGDRFFVPRKPSTVVVAGHVFNRNSAFLFNSNKTLADYLNMAGGFKEGANQDQVYVMRADGSIMGSNNKGWMSGNALNQRALPGDTIIVPQELDKKTWVKGLMDWTQILSNFATGIAAISVLGD